ISAKMSESLHPSTRNCETSNVRQSVTAPSKPAVSASPMSREVSIVVHVAGRSVRCRATLARISSSRGSQVATNRMFDPSALASARARVFFPLAAPPVSKVSKAIRETASDELARFEGGDDEGEPACDHRQAADRNDHREDFGVREHPSVQEA